MVIGGCNWNKIGKIQGSELQIAPLRERDRAIHLKCAAIKQKRRVSQKLYYSISEVAAMFKVNASLIRFWEKEFTIIKPRKNQKGNRFFTQHDIDNISLIYHYVKERGMTLKGARQKIKENKEDAENTFKIVQSLKKMRTILIEIKENMEA